MIFDTCDPILCTNSDERQAIKQFAQQVVIVIQSCNDNEYYASLQLMKAPNITKPDGQSQLFERAVRFPNEDNMAVTLGMFADCKAAIAWTEQGASCEKDIHKVLSWFPNIRAILGVGVAFGMERSDVNFCDVLVASQIADLGNRTRLEDRRVVAEGRGGDTTSTKTPLNNIFCKDVKGWKFQCTDTSRQAKAVPGLLVSGSFLLDGRRVKLSLQEQYKSAKGGEMEGGILYRIVKNKPNLAAIIIKGVADYADGEKDKRWQLTAAMAAAKYTHFQLKRSTAFHGMSTVEGLRSIVV